ncbi:hypothetical protein [Actinoplanes teichomyceticus]|uniref:Uncharacterized protein n=1 Tax=Actinoplanes teichomyceticus TaxID=1867 RepID=A0A561VLI6_ACTTI|nr:hypothetical protein [Actinoplanes teichomyceticus]TWG12483.1 hypothetical protein FHX34_105350 [Actinoplanes teichomyceticus]GIF13848.1 hypothetical protein Ate01nite_38800 [Actinoplanes teichomyceticus]
MNPQDQQRPVGAAAVVGAFVLGLDAIASLLAGLLLALPAVGTRFDTGPQDARTGIAAVAVASLFALVCPAAAALVGGLRTRAAHVFGCVVTAVMAVLVAGGSALLLPATDNVSENEVGLAVIGLAAAVLLANIAALAVLLGTLRPARAHAHR